MVQIGWCLLQHLHFRTVRKTVSRVKNYPLAGGDPGADDRLIPVPRADADRSTFGAAILHYEYLVPAVVLHDCCLGDHHEAVVGALRRFAACAGVEGYFDAHLR